MQTEPKTTQAGERTQLSYQDEIALNAGAFAISDEGKRTLAERSTASASQNRAKLGDTLDDDKRAARIGAKIALMLNLRRDTEYPDRWKTAWGSKTNAGLARTVAVAFDEEIAS
jgi:hypothetical protein